VGTLIAVMVALGLTTSSLGGLLAVVIGVDSALFVALVAISYWLVEQPAPAAADQPVGAAA
jgi:hypothetical protein